MNIIKFFTMNPEVTFTTDYTYEEFMKVLESKTKFKSMNSTANADTNSYLFIPFGTKDPTIHSLMPTSKSSGMNHSILMPIFDFQIQPTTVPDKTEIKVKAHPIFSMYIATVTILALAMLNGALAIVQALSNGEYELILTGLGLLIFPILFMLFGFWFPYKNTMEEIRSIMIKN